MSSRVIPAADVREGDLLFHCGRVTDVWTDRTGMVRIEATAQNLPPQAPNQGVVVINEESP